MSEPDPGELAELACSVAGQAAELLMRDRGTAQVVQVKSSPTDIVTAMDKAAETLIRGRLLAARPDDAILGEEEGQTGDGLVRWIVDPLDGTVNYLYGLPDWSVSIAAEVSGVIVAGAVCVPVRREVFSAAIGGGAWLQTDEQAGPSAAASLPASRTRTRWSPPVSAIRPGTARPRAWSSPRCCRRCATSGGPAAAAADLCSVAAKPAPMRTTSKGVHYWDIAAGGLVDPCAGRNGNRELARPKRGDGKR